MNAKDTAKVVSIVCLFLVPLILGLLPVIIARKFKLRGSDNEISPTVKTTISALLCFGGGVMMATAFIHILPEIHNAMMSFGLSDTVPLAEVLCCCGFFLIYLVEELVHMISERKSKREMHQSNTNQSEGNASVKIVDGARSLDTEPVSDGAEEKAGHGHSHIHASMTPSLEGFIIVVGLSLHSVFEGMAIGLEDTATGVWTLLAAVGSHKLVIAFCVGLELSVTGITLALHTCYMLTFCVATPLGIGIGMIFTEDETEKQISVILQALAAGTMLYVAFFEVIARERTKSVNKLVQLATIVFGYGLMLALDTLLKDGD